MSMTRRAVTWAVTITVADHNDELLVCRVASAGREFTFTSQPSMAEATLTEMLSMSIRSRAPMLDDDNDELLVWGGK